MRQSVFEFLKTKVQSKYLAEKIIILGSPVIEIDEGTLYDNSYIRRKELEDIEEDLYYEIEKLYNYDLEESYTNPIETIRLIFNIKDRITEILRCRFVKIINSTKLMIDFFNHIVPIDEMLNKLLEYAEDEWNEQEIKRTKKLIFNYKKF